MMKTADVVIAGGGVMGCSIALHLREAGASRVIVIVPGYPPDRSALDAWNYARGHVRLVVVVDGPPLDPIQLEGLNTL